MNWLHGLRRSALVGACLLLGTGLPARADLILNTPGGLNPGDKFRIAFVTAGTRDATSTNIADYNTFVTDDAIAQAGGVGNLVRYDTTALTWKAIGSTAAVTAISNIGTFNVPVYLASGVLIAASDGTSGLFAGSTTPLAAKLDQDLTGTTRGPYVWTGSIASGQAFGQYELGSSSPIAGDNTYKINGYWLKASSFSNVSGESLYGISQVLTVPGGPPPGVPEPATWLAAALGGLGLVVRRVQWHWAQS